MAEIKNPKNQSVKNQLISITKTLLKEAENDTQKNMLLDSLAEIKKITLPGNATQSVMEQVEDF